MRFNCTYDVLVNKLTDVANVVEDSMSSDELKNIIIRLDSTKNEVTLVGLNQLITLKRIIPAEHCSFELEEGEGTNGILFLQLKSKELLNFLNSYKSVRTTRVEDVTFELNTRGVVICKVLEKDVETEKPYVSNWAFQNIPIKENMRQMINLPAPEGELMQLPSVNLLWYTKTLLPVLTNGTNLFSQMLMGDTYVVAFNTAYVALMANQFKGTGLFENLKFSYRALTFLDKIICNEPMYDVARTDTHIYFKSENTEAFVRYDTKMAEYGTYVSAFKREHAITLDRILFKDIMKRLSLLNDTVEVVIDAEVNEITLSNSKYTQTIPIDSTENFAEVGKLSFKIMPDVLNKAILGDDTEFTPDFNIYYCPQQGGSAVIVFTDSSKTWFSVVKVKVQQI